MKIAIPVERGRLSSHFGGSSHFAVIEVDGNSKTVQRSETLPAPEHQPGLFPRWLRDQGAQVVIAGGIGQRALAIFAQNGVQVVSGQPGATVEALVAAYLAGELNRPPEACAHHHEHDQHGHMGTTP
jgi:predicted Fe-Mo cluster-binding NifX family protein